MPPKLPPICTSFPTPPSSPSSASGASGASMTSASAFTPDPEEPVQPLFTHQPLDRTRPPSPSDSTHSLEDTSDAATFTESWIAPGLIRHVHPFGTGFRRPNVERLGNPFFDEDFRDRFAFSMPSPPRSSQSDRSYYSPRESFSERLVPIEAGSGYSGASDEAGQSDTSQPGAYSLLAALRLVDNPFITETPSSITHTSQDPSRGPSSTSTVPPLLDPTDVHDNALQSPTTRPSDQVATLTHASAVTLFDDQATVYPLRVGGLPDTAGHQEAHFATDDSWEPRGVEEEGVKARDTLEFPSGRREFHITPKLDYRPKPTPDPTSQSMPVASHRPRNLPSHVHGESTAAADGHRPMQPSGADTIRQPPGNANQSTNDVRSRGWLGRLGVTIKSLRRLVARKLFCLAHTIDHNADPDTTSAPDRLHQARDEPHIIGPNDPPPYDVPLPLSPSSPDPEQRLPRSPAQTDSPTVVRDSVTFSTPASPSVKTAPFEHPGYFVSTQRSTAADISTSQQIAPSIAVHPPTASALERARPQGPFFAASNVPRGLPGGFGEGPSENPEGDDRKDGAENKKPPEKKGKKPMRRPSGSASLPSSPAKSLKPARFFARKPSREEGDLPTSEYPPRSPNPAQLAGGRKGDTSRSPSQPPPVENPVYPPASRQNAGPGPSSQRQGLGVESQQTETAQGETGPGTTYPPPPNPDSTLDPEALYRHGALQRVRGWFGLGTGSSSQARSGHRSGNQHGVVSAGAAAGEGNPASHSMARETQAIVPPQVLSTVGQGREERKSGGRPVSAGQQAAQHPSRWAKRVNSSNIFKQAGSVNPSSEYENSRSRNKRTRPFTAPAAGMRSPGEPSQERDVPDRGCGLGPCRLAHVARDQLQGQSPPVGPSTSNRSSPQSRSSQPPDSSQPPVTTKQSGSAPFQQPSSGRPRSAGGSAPSPTPNDPVQGEQTPRSGEQHGAPRAQQRIDQEESVQDLQVESAPRRQQHLPEDQLPFEELPQPTLQAPQHDSSVPGTDGNSIAGTTSDPGHRPTSAPLPTGSTPLKNVATESDSTGGHSSLGRESAEAPEGSRLSSLRPPLRPHRPVSLPGDLRTPAAVDMVRAQTSVEPQASQPSPPVRSTSPALSPVDPSTAPTPITLGLYPLLLPQSASMVQSGSGSNASRGTFGQAMSASSEDLRSLGLLSKAPPTRQKATSPVSAIDFGDNGRSDSSRSEVETTVGKNASFMERQPLLSDGTPPTPTSGACSSVSEGARKKEDHAQPFGPGSEYEAPESSSGGNGTIHLQPEIRGYCRGTTEGETGERNFADPLVEEGGARGAQGSSGSENIESSAATAEDYLASTESLGINEGASSEQLPAKQDDSPTFRDTRGSQESGTVFSPNASTASRSSASDDTPRAAHHAQVQQPLDINIDCKNPDVSTVDVQHDSVGAGSSGPPGSQHSPMREGEVDPEGSEQFHSLSPINEEVLTSDYQPSTPSTTGISGYTFGDTPTGRPKQPISSMPATPSSVDISDRPAYPLPPSIPGSPQTLDRIARPVIAPATSGTSRALGEVIGLITDIRSFSAGNDIGGPVEAPPTGSSISALASYETSETGEVSMLEQEASDEAESTTETSSEDDIAAAEQPPGLPQDVTQRALPLGGPNRDRSPAYQESGRALEAAPSTLPQPIPAAETEGVSAAIQPVDSIRAEIPAAEKIESSTSAMSKPTESLSSTTSPTSLTTGTQNTAGLPEGPGTAEGVFHFQDDWVDLTLEGTPSHAVSEDIEPRTERTSRHGSPIVSPHGNGSEQESEYGHGHGSIMEETQEERGSRDRTHETHGPGNPSIPPAEDGGLPGRAGRVRRMWHRFKGAFRA
ncbi:hypothetical protein IAU59_001483 [Kwoniella sp. CBS 9459]